MFNSLCRFVFSLLGWKIQGKIPEGSPKALFVVCPHHSWKDFFLGLGTRAMLRIPISYLIKKEFFGNPILGWFFAKTGGTAVDRHSKNGMVQDVADVFAKRQQWYLAMAPEGTRQNVAKLRTGFYHIAHTAKIPIIFVGFEYPTRRVTIASELFYTSNNINDDLKKIAQHFAQIQGPQKSWIQNYQQDVF
jgi:1-acyl-sn-glycerol-3-phosphate acyltransferase